MVSIATHRPRNVDTKRAAAILYGDLGTSKAYVIGLAFALVGYSSFWLILAVSVLTILIGINYIVICKYFPNGGGVYASARRRSQLISMLGAFFIIADYLVTAALSTLSACYYLGFQQPVIFAAGFLALIGALNFFGPKHTGTLALIVAIGAVCMLIILACFTLPHLSTAWKNLRPLEGSYLDIWKNFTGVIVALSGIEAIANATGVMQLNPESSEKNPIVTRTSTRAIIVVICEVAIFTTLFSLAATAINNFIIIGNEVHAPGNPGVRDYMLRYIAEIFVGDMLGAHIGHIFALILSIVLGILLFSAANTAINGLIALQYLMSSDGEVPAYFQKINRFGVPFVPLLLATVVPILLVVLVRNVVGLADLYAVGFVGAIATNLGTTSTDFSLDLKKKERVLMFVSFLIMGLIEVTLLLDKPTARMYLFTVLLVGLILRALSKEIKEKEKEAPQVEEILPHAVKAPPPVLSILCPVWKFDKAVKVAVEKSKKNRQQLHLLFIREQKVISDADLTRNWETDLEAKKVMEYAKEYGDVELIQFYYSVSDSSYDTVASFVERCEASQLIIDLPRRNLLLRLLRGRTIKDLQHAMPHEISISIIS